jgi:predicted nucleotidyltransferase
LRTPLSEQREDADLYRFFDRLLAQRRDEVEFIVLFGSRARGNWSRDSDYDILVGLRGEDGKRLIDRMYDLSLLADGNLEVFPYARSEWERMFQGRNLLVLDALDHGKVLFDRGAFAAMQRLFHRWLDEGSLTRSGSGWRIPGP